MGRKRIIIEHKGIDLFFEDGVITIRVTRDIKKEQGLINFKLIEKKVTDKKIKLIYQSTDIDKVRNRSGTKQMKLILFFCRIISMFLILK